MKTQFLKMLLLAILVGLQPSVWANNGQLLVFLHQVDHPVSQDFSTKYLPQLQAMAAAQDISLQVIEVKDAAPELITLTPAIVFQNHLGRSLYIGRYHYIDKVKTFIRTVKRLPQQTVDHEKHDVLVAKLGRSTLVTPAIVVAACAAAWAPWPATNTWTSPPHWTAAATALSVAGLMVRLSCSAITSAVMVRSPWLQF